MPIYGKKTSKIFISRIQNSITLQHDMPYWGLKLYKSYMDDDPGLTLTVTKSFHGINLQQMTKLTEDLCI